MENEKRSKIIKEEKKKRFEKRFDFQNYSVIVRNESLVYVFGNVSYPIPTDFENTIDEPEEGRKIELNWCDRWGSSMRFIHFFPSNLQGMFDFIGKGYGIFDKIKNTKL